MNHSGCRPYHWKVPDDIAANRHPRCPELAQILGKARIKRRKNLLSALQETMQMIALWN
jgi:hypothetical protein